MTEERSIKDVLDELHLEFVGKSEDDLLLTIWKLRLQNVILQDNEQLYWVEDPRTGKKRQCTGEQLVKQVELLELSNMALQHSLGRYKKLSGSRMQQINVLKGKLKDSIIVAAQLQHEAHGGSARTGPMYQKDAIGG